MARFRENRRKGKRVALRRAVALLSDGKILQECLILDISERGARLEIPASVELPAEFALCLTHNGTVYRQCVAIWRSDNNVGVSFLSRPRSA